MMGRPVANKHRVAKKEWRKWSEHARRVFNDLYGELPPKSQWKVVSPYATLVPETHWQVLRWNVAWLAAEAANRA